MMKPESKKCPICGNNSVNVMIDAKIKCLVSDFGELYPINANLADIIRESEVLYGHCSVCNKKLLAEVDDKNNIVGFKKDEED